MTFNYKTNRILAGICEFCGIKAIDCTHYKEKPMPMDELKKLEAMEDANKVIAYTTPKNTPPPVLPLTEEEKAKSFEEYKQKTDEARKEVEAKQVSAEQSPEAPEQVSTDIPVTNEAAPVTESK
jgi:hypothetical protein